MAERLALYTTVYPGSEPYLGAWYRSVVAQDDRDFDVWIGIDSLNVDDVTAALGARDSDVFVFLPDGGTPTRIRERAVESLVDKYKAIVFADSDDVLYPSRVSAAREALRYFDVVGCALRIIDEKGRDLGIVFGPEGGETLDALLPRRNVFGLSNTAYRSDVLRRCLPFPDGCEIVDWLLATRAWTAGYTLHFDPVPRMAYRQYAANVARVLFPFSVEHVLSATKRVLGHYRCLLGTDCHLPAPYRRSIESACARVEDFYRAVSASPSTLETYVTKLNETRPQYIWWWCVAHPELDEVWKN